MEAARKIAEEKGAKLKRLVDMHSRRGEMIARVIDNSVKRSARRATFGTWRGFVLMMTSRRHREEALLSDSIASARRAGALQALNILQPAARRKVGRLLLERCLTRWQLAIRGDWNTVCAAKPIATPPPDDVPRQSPMPTTPAAASQDTTPKASSRGRMIRASMRADILPSPSISPKLTPKRRLKARSSSLRQSHSASTTRVKSPWDSSRLI